VNEDIGFYFRIKDQGSQKLFPRYMSPANSYSIPHVIIAYWVEVERIL